MYESSKAVKPWREAVKWAALEILRRCEPDVTWEPLTGPIRVDAVFRFPRPKSHYRTGKHAGELRADAPTFKSSKPDGEKLERSTYDALTDAGVWRDDAQVVEVHWTKIYHDTPGAWLTIEELT